MAEWYCVLHSLRKKRGEGDEAQIVLRSAMRLPYRRETVPDSETLNNDASQSAIKRQLPVSSFLSLFESQFYFPVIPYAPIRPNVMPATTSFERMLERFMEQLFCRWSKDLSKIHKRLDALHPSTTLPPIPSAKRGEVGFKREVNVTLVLRDAIDKANATIPDGQEKYIQFPEGYADKKLNTDAKDALDLLMLQNIGDDYGRLNWKSASRTTHREQCEAVIRLAAESRDFVVFRQTAFYWAIRDLADQKMKSKGRRNPSAIDGNVSANDEPAHAAPPVKRARIDERASAAPLQNVDPNIPKSTTTPATASQGIGRGSGRGRASRAGRGRGLGRGSGRGRGRGRGRGKASTVA